MWSTLPALTLQKHMWKEWVTAILGLAVIAAPFVGLAGDAFTWSLVILGALVAVVGFWSATENTSTYRSTSRLQHQ